jgi:hypothetical protein
MTPLTMAIEGATSSPPPLRRSTTGSIEVPSGRPAPARTLDKPPPFASYAEVEVTLEEKRSEPNGPPPKTP